MRPSSVAKKCFFGGILSAAALSLGCPSRPPGGVLTGTLTIDGQSPAGPSTTVVLFPVDAERNRKPTREQYAFNMIKTNRFTVVGIPPGQYEIMFQGLNIRPEDHYGRDDLFIEITGKTQTHNVALVSPQK